MTTDRRLWIRLAAISGFIAVAAGAFAAHGVSDPGARELLRTGAQYQAIHALAALLAVALGSSSGKRGGLTPGLFLAGTLLFSGSLYAMALGAPRLLGAVTPLGGLMFLAGWAGLAISAGGRGGR